MKLLLIGLAVTTALAASGAHAFTFESGGPARSQQGTQLSDPDSPRPFNFNGSDNQQSSSTTLFRNGDSSLSFGLTRQENRPGAFLQPAPFRNMGPPFFRPFPGAPN